MIITRTPLRVSFVGGGSDLPGFCSREAGHCISATISESVYVIVNRKRSPDKIRISYSRTELVDEVSQIEHDIVRETLKMFLESDPNWYVGNLEIASIADLPTQTGLGSSGAFTVGLIQALASSKEVYYSPRQLAEYASYVEIHKCGKPIGLQDQTASAFGGLRAYTFEDDRVVDCEDLGGYPSSRKLQRRLLLVDLRTRGPSSEPLSQLNFEDSRVRSTIRSMSNLAEGFRDALVRENLDECGEILDASWSLKRRLDGVTNEEIDRVYSFAREHGAIGGKICGAGGRGMLLLFSRESRRPDLAIALQQEFRLSSIGVQFEPFGSRVVYSL